MRKRFTLASISLVLLLALGLFALFGIPPLVRQVVLKSIALDPQRVQTWGQNPGHSKTVTMRNFTFHNFTNPRRYLYRNQKPRFHQITNYHLQERTNFTNISYSEDKSIVYFNYWLHFTQLQTSRNLDQYVHVLNLGPLGYWKQCETVDISWVAIQGFGGLFFELNGSMKAQAIGKGVASQYLKDFSSLSNSLCTPMDLSYSGCHMLWEDPIFGLQDENHYKLWVNWALYGSINDGTKIAQYFGFTKFQLITFKQIFSFWCSSMSSILENWYCQGQPCSSYQMMITQLSTSTITNNPPSGDPQDSICLTGNVTCSGWPQLNAFYKKQFEPKQTQARFKNLTFPKQTVKKLFTPYTGVFLNVGNLSKVFKYGWPYDKNNTDLDNLALLRSVTAAETDEQAIVFWQYLKYFVYQFVSKNSQGGSRKLSGLGQAFNKYLYYTFNKYYDWLPKQYISLLVAESVGNCTEFILNTIEGITLQKSQYICGNASKQNYRQYYRLIEPCNNELIQEDILKNYNLNLFERSEYCDDTDLSLRTVLDSVHKRMYEWFNCTANKITQKCSFQELTLKQFFDSELTLQPIPNSIKNYTASTTAHHWNPDLGQWEYRHFLNQVYDDPYYDKQQFTYAQKADLLSFDKLLSNPILSKIYILNDDQQLKKILYWENRTLLRQWVRFFTIEVAFGGLIQKRTVREMLFGYQDPFLNQIKNQDLMRGGDPSRDPVLSMNQPNQTLEQAQKYISSMYSGFGDPYQTRNFITKDNQSYIFYQKNSFDGYNVCKEKVTPFRQNIPLKGTDGTQSKPLTQPDQYIYVYVDAMKRITEMNLKQQTDRYGFTARRYRPTERSIASSKVEPANDVYYQGFTGLNNVSFKGAPIFVGGNHFRKTDPLDDWASKVEFYDESGTYQQFTSSYDDSQLVLQPVSGATFTATTFLQTNLYFPTDLLFPNPPTMLPLFTVYRSGNMSQDIAHQLLGPLMVGLKAPKIIVIVCGIGMGMVIVSMYICHRRLKIVKDGQRIDSSLIESLNQKEGDIQKIQDNPQSLEVDQTQSKYLVQNQLPLQNQFKNEKTIQVEIKEGALNETIHIEVQQQKKED